MKTWLLNRWDALRTNFWVVPSLMVAGAILLSYLTITIDDLLGQDNAIATLHWVKTKGPEGSRQLLATVAGSMITIATLTFSITIVALQLASSQFGPRLLRNFMRDKGNKVVLGTFIATFTYCLLVLRSVSGDEDDPFVPHLSVTVGVVLALASLGVLIYFINHAAESIQADYVVASVSRDLHESIAWLFPKPNDRTPSATSPRWIPGGLPEGFERGARSVPSPRSGYIEAIDQDTLGRLAVEHDLVLRVDYRPGKFVNEGSRVVLAWPSERTNDTLVEAIQRAFYIGDRRTLTQDVEFAIDQLVEMAVRALSPGINDPFTAIACINRLGAGLCELASREIPSGHRHDDKGQLRLVADASTMDGLVDACFHQIRQAALGNAAVTLRLLECLAEVAEHAHDETFRAALLRHAELINQGSQSSLSQEFDRQEARNRYLDARSKLEPRHPLESDRATQGSVKARNAP